MDKNKTERPVGTFKCLNCGAICDGSKVKINRSPSPDGDALYLCQYGLCMGKVRKISDLPHEEWLKMKQKKAAE